MGASSCPDLKFAKTRSVKLERHEKRGKVKTDRAKNKVAAKKRDGKKCRWHQAHKCFGVIESAHLESLKMGGDPLGIRSETSNLFTACSGVHREFDESFHKNNLRVEPLDPLKGADGPCRGLSAVPWEDRATETSGTDWIEVWREYAVGRVEGKK